MKKAVIPGTVHLICDEDYQRNRLSQLLRTKGYEVQTQDSPPRFLEAVGPESRGCVVAHVRQAEKAGAELLAGIKARGLDLPLIVVTPPPQVGFAIQEMKEGAVNFIETPFTAEAFLSAIGAALARSGEPVDRDRERERHLATLATLTERERQILGALIKGKTNETIADELGVSAESVAADHVALLAKTHAQSLSDLVRLAVHAIAVDDCA